MLLMLQNKKSYATHKMKRIFPQRERLKALFLTLTNSKMSP